ncbi:hypothetical protein ACKLNO_08400 [Neisseriaceae bacterium B1]
MSNTIDKFINSSLSLAFFTLTAFSTAYCYCWGLAWFHGLPWWHIQIDNSTIARSLAWVIGSSLILLFSYISGYFLLQKISKYQYFQQMGFLRILLLVSVFSIPVLLTFYVFIGNIPSYVSLIYFVIVLFCTALWRNKWNNTDLQLDFRKVFIGKYFLLFSFFCILVFCL